MPPRTGGAGKKNSPSIFAGSFAQLRLHDWFRVNVEKLRKSDLEGGGLTLPRQPWGEATLKKHPHLSDLKKWLERYGFSIQQVRTQMGYYSGSTMPLTAGGLIETDDEAEARLRLGIGDVDALGRDCADAVMDPARSAPCLPGAKGGVHHRAFFTENHASVATYCAAYIDVLVTLLVDARAAKKSDVNERERAFTEKRLQWTTLMCKLGKDATADPPALGEDPSTATAIGRAARFRMRKVERNAIELQSFGVRDVARRLDSTVAVMYLNAMHSATYWVFARALGGGELAVAIPADGMFPLPPPDSDEAGVQTYIGGWLGHKCLKYIRADGRGRHPPGFMLAAAAVSDSALGFQPSTTFDAFVMDFYNRATIAPEEAQAAARRKKLNLSRAEQRFSVVGCTITYPSGRMYAFTNLLEGVCRETFQRAGKTMGPTALLSIQRALLMSEIVMIKFLDVFRSKPQTNLVRFGPADDSRVDQRLALFFDHDSKEIDRAVGAVEVCASHAKELLTVIVAAYIQMRGRDVVRGMMADLTTAEQSSSHTAFRSAVGTGGLGGSKRRAVDGIQVQDEDDGASPISPLAEIADGNYSLLDGATSDDLPRHLEDCNCGGWTTNARYCKLDPHWKCGKCGVDDQPYYLAATCCNSDEEPIMSGVGSEQ
jgi:hypothetical protein